jgi:hypothetical protein
MENNGGDMCQDCKCATYRVAIDQQRMMIDAKDREIDKLRTENTAMRRTIANTNDRLQKLLDTTEGSIKRVEASLGIAGVA